MVSRKFMKAFAPGLLLLALISFTGCSSREEAMERTDQQNEPVSTGDGEIAFWIDDSPITMHELEIFAQRHIKASSGGHGGSHGPSLTFEPLELIRPYLRYYALVKEGEKRGLDDGSDFRKVMDFNRMRSLGALYLDHIQQTVAIPPERIIGKVPTKWVQIDFELFLFGTMEEAKAAREQLGNDFDLDRLIKLATPVGGDQRPKTGLIFPGSGFFDPIDDSYLFSLNQDDISDPVLSGLGPAIARIAQRYDLSEEEKGIHLAKIRKQLSQELSQKEVAIIFETAGIVTFRDVIGRSTADEMSSGVWLRDVVATVDGTELTYYEFRWMFTPNFEFYKKIYPAEKIPDIVGQDIKRLARQVALGKAALKDDSFSPVQDQESSMSWDRNDLFYQMIQSDIWNETSVSVDEEQVRQYYQNNMIKFGAPALVRFHSYFTPVKEDLDVLWRRYEEGVPFDHLSEDMKSGVLAPHSQSGLTMKTQRLPVMEGDEFSEFIFSLDIGAVEVISGKMGLHLVKVIGKVESSIKPFDEIQDVVERTMTRDQRRALMSKYIEDLEDTYSVRINREVPEPIQDVPDGLKDTG